MDLRRRAAGRWRWPRRLAECGWRSTAGGVRLVAAEAACRGRLAEAGLAECGWRL